MTGRRATGTGGGRRPDATRALASCAIAIGGLVLAGWALGLDSLTRLVPGLIAMKPNTALALLLAGAALWSIREGRPTSRRAIGLSIAVAAVGGLTILEYAAHIDLGIDEALFRGPAGEIGSLAPGRMQPSTAFDFFCLGIALALMAADRDHRSAHGLALLAALVAGSTLVGYLFGVRRFVGLAVYNQMALHTTLGVLALSAGVLLARPGRGLMAGITSRGPGGLMARMLIPVAVLTPIVVDGLTLLASRAGYLDEVYSAAVRATGMMAILVGFIGRNAAMLHRVDVCREEAEAERLETEGRYRFLAESMPQIVWMSRPDGEVQYVNRRWFEFSGQDPDLGVDWRTVLHPEDLGPCMDLWERSRATGEVFEGEYRFRRADGAYRWHLARSEPRRDESGRVVQWVGTSTDVHDQKFTSEQRYRSLVEATTSIVWHTPACGNFESEQPGWSDFTGQAFDQLRGSGWLQAIHPDDRPETARVWSTAVDSRSLYRVEHRIRRHDGEYRHMLVRAVPLLDDRGEVSEWFGVHTDVDELKRAQEAMREAKEAAEAATKAKGEFLANMSHEIRTPMNGIIGMTELALSTELSPRQREYLGLVKISADALLMIINDILDFSKIEAGKLELDPVPFSIQDRVSDTLRGLAPKAHEKGLELACRIAPGVPGTVVGDPGRLRQVLLNLVGNAVKFTDRGEVVVTVELDPGADAPDLLRFSVADTGIGIPDDKRAAMFVPFEQGDGSTTRKYGGTGLGLSISLRLVALMGGRIWIEDNPGGGTIFRFTARLASDPDVRAARPETSPIVLDRLRILIVDDNRTNRLILEEILTQWGCLPLAVEDAPQALAALDRAVARVEPIALVLLDRMMPEMDGIELARRIKADPRHRAVKILLLTSGGPDDAVSFRDLGIDSWLSKPVRQSDLLNAVLDLLGAEEAPTGPAPEASPPPPPAPPRRHLRVLLVDDHPINQVVCRRMLEDQGHEVIVAGNGRLAVEAVAAGAFDAVLMDLQMPEMDGFEALSIIRGREPDRGGHLPIVALTAHAMAGDRERCLVSGFDEYLSKPIQAATLASILERVVEVDRAAPPPALPGPPEPDPVGRPAFDLEAALRGLGGDEGLLAEILKIFLDDGPRALEETRLAVEAGDSRSLKRIGHTLAGAASHFEAPDFVASARRLEAMGKGGDLAIAGDVLRDLAREFDRFRRALDESGFALEARAT